MTIGCMTARQSMLRLEVAAKSQQHKQLPVTEQHLNFLIMRRQVAGRIAAVLVLPAPLIPRRGQLVGCQCTAARCEAASDDNASFTIPALVALQHLGMHGDVLYAKGTAII